MLPLRRIRSSNATMYPYVATACDLAITLANVGPRTLYRHHCVPDVANLAIIQKDAKPQRDASTVTVPSFPTKTIPLSTNDAAPN